MQIRQLPPEEAAEAFSPRRLAGRGRPTRYDFYFIRADGVRYPSESEYMTAAAPIRLKGQQPSWAWALEALEADPTLWLVVPLPEPLPDQQQRLAAQVRGSIWATGVTRKGMHLASQWWDGRLWVRTYEPSVPVPPLT